MLAGLAKDDCPRVLINLERVGDFSNRADDVLLLGKCDEMVRDLCRELGWEEELEELWKTTEHSVEKDEDALDKEEKLKSDEKQLKERSAPVDKVDDESEVDTITSAIERSLAISSENSSPPDKTVNNPKTEGKVSQNPNPKVTSAGSSGMETASKEEGKL